MNSRRISKVKHTIKGNVMKLVNYLVIISSFLFVFSADLMEEKLFFVIPNIIIIKCLKKRL